MKTTSRKFFSLPDTKLGQWAAGLTILFVILFLLITNNLFHLPGMLTMAIGIVAGVLTLLALFWKRERSWLLWFALLPGIFAIVFTLGEILYPH